LTPREFTYVVTAVLIALVIPLVVVPPMGWAGHLKQTSKFGLLILPASLLLLAVPSRDWRLVAGTVAAIGLAGYSAGHNAGGIFDRDRYAGLRAFDTVDQTVEAIKQRYDDPNTDFWMLQQGLSYELTQQLKGTLYQMYAVGLPDGFRLTRGIYGRTEMPEYPEKGSELIVMSTDEDALNQIQDQYPDVDFTINQQSVISDGQQSYYLTFLTLQDDLPVHPAQSTILP
jgi:hypothetical protein